MWTPAARAQHARDHLPYATCLTEAEWSLVAPVLPPPSRKGLPRLWPLRLVVDAILYVLHWRHLPREFPPWAGVHRWFLRLAQAGTFERLCHRLVMANRERVGR